MSLIITKECINCGACEPECPNHAIYEGGTKWRMSEGTSLLKDNKNSIYQNPKEQDHYFIVPDKCTECIGFYDVPQCATVCPVNCCILNEQNVETKENLIKKKNFLHHN
ncbi:4Fe-4S dicluster domain-containing protein [Blattabacterium cuenoti]|uniref:4Fe-4S dicluster domain-containing protein n=1 Tax=Blattabacterium cuenoti TaxID=1653831 RepID=UPI00163B9FC1|nr:4Fe-4S dicluster domain-containing protein [Blattabacterium cuenoti]